MNGKRKNEVAWTSEMREALREMIVAGASFREAAQRLSDKFNVTLSRCAVAGACLRNGIKCAVKKPRVYVVGSGRKKKPPSHLVEHKLSPTQKVRAYKAAIRKQVDGPLGPKNDFPARGNCKWIYGHPGDGEWRCCARPARSGVYCEHHKARTVIDDAQFRRASIEKKRPHIVQILPRRPQTVSLKPIRSIRDVLH